MPSPNLQLLTDAARQLKPLLGELVFVGGCATALLVTDSAAADVRPTYDVHVIADIASYTDYLAFSGKLAKLGFTEDHSEGAPVCRWRQNQTILDVMPISEKILGFSNRWYRPAMDSAQPLDLENGLRIRLVTSVYFCATKLVAFRGRGKGDFFSSHDLEDLIAVVDGRSELVGEVRTAPPDVRAFIASEIKDLLDAQAFVDALPGYLLPDSASQGRLPGLMERLHSLATL